MITNTFKISTRKAERRLSSTLQHKLRVVMKCYTIINFSINQEQNTFSFNKTNNIRGIVINDGKNYNGSYVLEKIPESEEGFEYKLIINVYS
jgi:hypothetical protein